MDVGDGRSADQGAEIGRARDTRLGSGTGSSSPGMPA